MKTKTPNVVLSNCTVYIKCASMATVAWRRSLFYNVCHTILLLLHFSTINLSLINVCVNALLPVTPLNLCRVVRCGAEQQREREGTENMIFENESCMSTKKNDGKPLSLISPHIYNTITHISDVNRIVKIPLLSSVRRRRWCMMIDTYHCSGPFLQSENINFTPTVSTSGVDDIFNTICQCNITELCVQYACKV